MCGIAGILNLDGSPCDPEALCLITDALAHRGPDGRGFHVDGPLGLGHRRLAILDLSDSGKQPMSVIDGRYWITYNGEVYNFLELRRELEGLGHRFTSQSDTEIIGAAYHQWGADCLLKFNGMWALAIWDSHRHELFLSRDRFGIKPLHYLDESRRFVFASELKAFRRLRGFTPRENEPEMKQALETGRQSIEDTLLQGVKQLPAGHNILVSASGLRLLRWWRTLDHLPEVPRRFSDQVDRFRELFFDSCRLRLRSDVPVATCLSGGLDSSSILCSIAAMRARAVSAGQAERLTPDFHRAFVATFPGTTQDEQEYAEAAIRQSGADPRYRMMSAGAMIDDLLQYAHDFESVERVLLIPVWRLYRELRRDGVVVSLDGQGSDELLAGYEFTLRAALTHHGGLLRAPVRTMDLARTIHGMRGSALAGVPDIMDLLIERDPWLRTLRRAAGGARRLARRLVGARTRSSVGPGAQQAAMQGWAPMRSEADADERAMKETLTPLNQSLYMQFHHGGLPQILRQYDRLSMAHGIESRMPFMDWRLVCYSFALPDSTKAGGGFTKRVLREAMRGVLPEKVRTRKSKIGFNSPMQSWFSGELGDWVHEQVQTARFLQGDLYDGPAIRDFVMATHASKSWTDAKARRVWPFVQAHLWRQTFLD